MHRPDDTIAALTKRMTGYKEQTTPILDYYKKQNLLFTINATASMADVKAQIADGVFKK